MVLLAVGEAFVEGVGHHVVVAGGEESRPGQEGGQLVGWEVATKAR